MPVALEERIREMAEDATLSRREAADYAGVHYNTIRLWEQRGKLHTKRVTVGGVEEVRVQVSELDAIMAERPSHPGTLRPPGLSAERTTMWELSVENERLKAENALLRVQLERCIAERQEMLDNLLRLTGKE